MIQNINYLSIDHIIVYGFLIIVLLVGLLAGRKIKDIKDYALANKSYGSGVGLGHSILKIFFLTF